MSAVPLSEVKTHLQMDLTKTSNDVELQRFIDAAETAIGHRVGPLTPVSVTEKHDGGSAVLVLRTYPAASLTSAGYTNGDTITVGDLDLDGPAGAVYWNTGTAGWFTSGVRNVTITYSAGWSTLPEDLRHAVKELVRHLWETQRGNNTPARPGFTDEPPVVGAFSSWPVRVQELVEPYHAPQVA